MNANNDSNEYELEILRLRQLLESERRKARTDALTQLDNRLSFEENVQRLREAGTTFAVVLFDAANLHYANKVLGLDGGDALLRRIASCIRSDSDLAFRIGGDEFAVLVPTDGTEPVSALHIAAKVEVRIAVEVGSVKLAPGVTFFLAGASAVHDPKKDTWEETYSWVSASLARAKLAGKVVRGDVAEARTL